MAFDFNKFRNLFVENTTDPNANSNKDSKSEPQVNNSVSSVSSKSSGSSGNIDKTVIEALYKTIEEHNLPGEDYLEFIEALKAMQNIQLDDNLKIQTVMATLSTKGLNASKIKESADYYKKILVNEQNQFITELNSQVEKNINAKKKTIETLNASIKQKTDQIALLTKEITEAQQNVSTNETLIKAAESKIETAKENFNLAYGFVINEINENLSKIK